MEERKKHKKPGERATRARNAQLSIAEGEYVELPGARMHEDLSRSVSAKRTRQAVRVPAMLVRVKVAGNGF